MKKFYSELKIKISILLIAALCLNSTNCVFADVKIPEMNNETISTQAPSSEDSGETITSSEKTETINDNSDNATNASNESDISNKADDNDAVNKADENIEETLKENNDDNEDKADTEEIVSPDDNDNSTIDNKTNDMDELEDEISSISEVDIDKLDDADDINIKNDFAISSASVLDDVVFTSIFLATYSEICIATVSNITISTMSNLFGISLATKSVATMSVATNSDLSNLEFIDQLLYFDNDSAKYEGDKVVLLKNIVIDKSLFVLKNTNFDLNNFKILASTLSTALFVKNAQFNIYNTVDTNNGNAENAGGIYANTNLVNIINANNSSINFYGGTFKAGDGAICVNASDTSFRIENANIYGGNGIKTSIKDEEKLLDGKEAFYLNYSDQNYYFDFISGSIFGGNGADGNIRTYGGDAGNGIVIGNIVINRNYFDNSYMEGLSGYAYAGNGGNAIYSNDGSKFNAKININSKGIHGGNAGNEIIIKKLFKTTKGLKNNLLNNESLPPRYDSRDIKVNGRPIITGIKTQGQAGICWDYAMTGFAETWILKNYPWYVDALSLDKNDEFDLSELKTAYYYTYNFMDPLENVKTYQRYSASKSFLERGCNTTDVTGLLNSPVGLSLDSKYRYLQPLRVLADQNETSGQSDGSYNLLNDIKNVENVLEKTLDDDQNTFDNTVMLKSTKIVNRKDFSSNREYAKAMRNYIKEYGAVKLDYYASVDANTFARENNFIYNGEKIAAIYEATASDGAHSVLAIGWDDNFPKEYFATASRTDQEDKLDDGALIIKNSWGTTGPYYISYDYDFDPNSDGFTVCEWIPQDAKYQNVYMYNAGQSTGAAEILASYSVLNMFEVKHKKERLSAISFQNLDGNIKSFDIGVYKIDKATISALKKADFYNYLWYKANYNVHIGLNTIDIPNLERIDFNKGDCYAVVLKNCVFKDGFNNERYQVIADVTYNDCYAEPMLKSAYGKIEEDGVSNFWELQDDSNYSIRTYTEDLIEYNIYLDYGDEGITTISTTHKYPYEIIKDYNVPQKEGYTFKCWCDNKFGNGRYYNDTNKKLSYFGYYDLYLYPVFTKNETLTINIIDNKNKKENIYTKKFELQQYDYWDRTIEFVEKTYKDYLKQYNLQDYIQPNEDVYLEGTIGDDGTNILYDRIWNLKPTNNVYNIDVYMDCIDITFKNTKKTLPDGTELEDLKLFIPYGTKEFPITLPIFDRYRVNGDIFKINGREQLYYVFYNVFIGDEVTQKEKTIIIDKYFNESKIYPCRVNFISSNNVSSISVAKGLNTLYYDSNYIFTSTISFIQKEFVDTYFSSILGIDKTALINSDFYQAGIDCYYEYYDYTDQNNPKLVEPKKIDPWNENDLFSNKFNDPPYAISFAIDENKLHGKQIIIASGSEVYKTIKLPNIATNYEITKKNMNLLPDDAKTFYANEYDPNFSYPIYYNNQSNVDLTNTNIKTLQGIEKPDSIVKIYYKYDNLTDKYYKSELEKIETPSYIWTSMNDNDKKLKTREYIDTNKYLILTYFDDADNEYCDYYDDSESKIINKLLEYNTPGIIYGEEIFTGLFKYNDLAVNLQYNTGNNFFGTNIDLSDYRDNIYKATYGQIEKEVLEKASNSSPTVKSLTENPVLSRDLCSKQTFNENALLFDLIYDGRKISSNLTINQKYNVSDKKPDPTPTPQGGGSSSSGGGGGGGSISAGALINGQLVPTAAPKEQTVLSVRPSDDKIPVANVQSSIWITDPITGSLKMTFVNELGQVQQCANGFYNLVKTEYVIDPITNIPIPKVTKASYYFDAAGNMQTGWVKTLDGKTYFFDNEKTNNEGNMSIGWKQIQGTWYYFNDDGSMLTNGVTKDGQIIGADGKWVNPNATNTQMQTNGAQVNANINGALLTTSASYATSVTNYQNALAKYQAILATIQNGKVK